MATTISGNLGLRRAPFDRDDTFVLLKTTKVAGHVFIVGEIFDKSLVPTRRLRQMYESRWITVYAGKDKSSDKTSDLVLPVKPDFVELSSQGLRQWLCNHEYVARPRMTHTQLVKLAENKWQEMIDVLTTAHRDSQHSGQRISGKIDNGHLETRTTS